jgi:hypothetical protein
MAFRQIITVYFLSFFICNAYCQSTVLTATGEVKKAKIFHKYFIRSPYLTFTNFIPPSVDMYEFHFGYRIDPENIIAIKAATWSLFEPMGIPWGPHKMMKGEEYSGRVREYGIGFCYQRMLWKGLYASVEVMPMKKIFLDKNNNKVADGFRLYSTYHLGYHISMLKNRIFIEPQIHCNYWPIDSKGPTGFKEVEEKWNNYFLFEPNIYIGVNF